jgi:hypothetical protein
MHDQIEPYAAGALSDQDREGVRVHLESGCNACNGAFRDAQETLAAYALSALTPAVVVRPSLKDRLDVRIDSDDEAGLSRAERGVLGKIGMERPPRRLPWLLPAAIAAGLSAALTLGLMSLETSRLNLEIVGRTKEVDGLRLTQGRLETEVAELTTARDEALAKLDEASTQLASLQAELVKVRQQSSEGSDLVVALREELRVTGEMLRSQQLLALELKGQDASPTASARLMIDLKQKVWKLYTADLKPLDGRVYEFWLITADGTPVPMGSFTPDAEGRGSLGDKVPDPLPKLAKAAISDEPGPNARTPSGRLHVVGEFPQ